MGRIIPSGNIYFERGVNRLPQVTAIPAFQKKQPLADQIGESLDFANKLGAHPLTGVLANMLLNRPRPPEEPSPSGGAPVATPTATGPDIAAAIAKALEGQMVPAPMPSGPPADTWEQMAMDQGVPPPMPMVSPIAMARERETAAARRLFPGQPEYPVPRVVAPGVAVEREPKPMTRPVPAPPEIDIAPAAGTTDTWEQMAAMARTGPGAIPAPVAATGRQPVQPAAITDRATADIAAMQADTPEEQLAVLRSAAYREDVKPTSAWDALSGAYLSRETDRLRGLFPQAPSARDVAATEYTRALTAAKAQQPPVGRDYEAMAELDMAKKLKEEAHARMFDRMHQKGPGRGAGRGRSVGGTGGGRRDILEAWRQAIDKLQSETGAATATVTRIQTAMSKEEAGVTAAMEQAKGLNEAFTSMAMGIPQVELRKAEYQRMLAEATQAGAHLRFGKGVLAQFPDAPSLQRAIAAIDRDIKQAASEREKILGALGKTRTMGAGARQSLIELGAIAAATETALEELKRQYMAGIRARTQGRRSTEAWLLQTTEPSP